MTVSIEEAAPFEGPEKLLEIWFERDVTSLSKLVNPLGLKVISQNQWQEMLDLVGCKILSVIRSKTVDAYLLSESSLFVFSHKLILKTCGTTTLLYGVGKILDLAKEYALFTTPPSQVFYSRRNFMFPERQLGPHRSWEDEVHMLQAYFPNGKPYRIGSKNEQHHWLLYMAESRAATSAVPTISQILEDETLEVLMTDLGECSQFYNMSTDEDERRAHLLGRKCSDGIGLSALYPLLKVEQDAYLFSPCGLSVNAIISPDEHMSKNLGYYYTIHVTPQPDCSYASFETNVTARASGRSAHETIQNVVDTFRPKKFSATLFESLIGGPSKAKQSLTALSGYHLTEESTLRFNDYELLVATFEQV